MENKIIGANNTVEENKLQNKGEVEQMENTNTIILKGSEEVVSIVGFDKYEILGYQLVEALNENYILDDLVNNEVVEVENLYDNSNEYYNVGGNEYLVIEGYDNAYRKAVKYTEEVFEDCGISDELLNIADQQGLIDNSWFEEAWSELHENMSYNEGIEYLASEDELEQLEKGEIEEDEIRDNYYNSLQESIKGQELDEYRFQFGDDNFMRVVKEYGLIDMTKLAEYCVDCDGIGHSLASYDGEEINEGELYIYRVN